MRVHVGENELEIAQLQAALEYCLRILSENVMDRMVSDDLTMWECVTINRLWGLLSDKKPLVDVEPYTK